MRLAFAGTGSINKVHARAALHCGAELVAAVNHKAESMAAFAHEFGIARQYRTVGALLKAGGVDALVIGTPNYLHASQAIAALKVGVHVMVEKPMAMNAREAEKMVETSEKSGAQLMVAHCWRFDQDVLWLKKEAKKLGQIIRTKGYGVHTHWGPTGWFTQKKFAGGGAMADMGIHALDTVRFLLGDPEPVSVYAKIGTYYKDFDVDDTGVLLVEWDNGTTSYIESGWWQPHCDGPEAATQLYGTKGFGQIFPTRFELPNAQTQQMDVVQSGSQFPRSEHDLQSMYEAQMAYFLRCIRRNKTPNPGGIEGWTNMKVVDAAYKSSKTGRVVAVK